MLLGTSWPFPGICYKATCCHPVHTKIAVLLATEQARHQKCSSTRKVLTLKRLRHQKNADTRNALAPEKCITYHRMPPDTVACRLAAWRLKIGPGSTVRKSQVYIRLWQTIGIHLNCGLQYKSLMRNPDEHCAAFSKSHCHLSRVHLPHFDCLEKYLRHPALG